MFVVNDDMSIYLTRGDIVILGVSALTNDAETYTFQAGDVVRIKVYEKKSAENVVLQKAFNVTKETETVEVFLTSEDTKLGEVISKPTDYWYEVELNPFTNPQTIIGYDEDGAKLFRIYPEGADEEIDIEPEDIPIVDAELDPASERPIQNQAVTRALMQVITDVETMIEDANKTLEELQAYASHLTNCANPHLVTARQAGAVSENDAFAKAGTTTFNEDGSITTTYGDGTSERTVFNEDGSITATRYVNGVAVEIATTTFEGDSITCDVSGGEE